MHRRAIVLLFAIAVASSGRAADAPSTWVVSPGAGKKIDCGPGLALTVKLQQPDALPRFLAGTGQVTGTSELRQHPGAEEVVHVNRGWGHVLIGGETIHVGPGSVVHIPPGVARQFISNDAGGMEYFFVLSNAASAPCGVSRSQSAGSGAVNIDPGSGERISYCLFPMTLTTKIDQESAPEATLTAAVGELRRGEESATHQRVDEIVFVTRGSGFAISDSGRTIVQAGSLVVNPAGTFHGLVNENADTLNYLIAFNRATPRSAFRKLATRAGVYCPSP